MPFPSALWSALQLPDSRAADRDRLAREAVTAAGEDVNGVSSDGTSVMHHTAASQSAQAVALLVTLGAVVDTPDHRNGRTPLWCAAYWNNAAALTVLLNAGAAINRTDASGQTPLWSAAQRGSSDTVGALLAAGADWRIPNRAGQTAEEAATEARQGPCALLLRLARERAALRAVVDPDRAAPPGRLHKM